MKRLIDELPPGFELSLLASEALDTPTEDARQAARRAGLAALGVVAVAGAATTVAMTSGGATGVTAATAGSVGAKAAVPTAMAAWKVLAIGVVVGGVAAGTGVTIARSPEETPAAQTTTPLASSSAPRVVAAHAPPVVSLAESASPIVPATSSSASQPTATSRTRPEPTFEPPTSMPAAPAADLAAEVRTLDAARVALERHDARAAVRELDAYAAAYPNGTLSPEATALRVEALAMRGDRAEATRLATELVAAHPSGPYRKRLEKALGAPVP